MTKFEDFVEACTDMERCDAWFLRGTGEAQHKQVYQTKKNREPRDSTPLQHWLFNYFFARKYNIPNVRSRCVFAVPVEEEDLKHWPGGELPTHDYGLTHRVWFPNGSTYISSTKHKDTLTITSKLAEMSRTWPPEYYDQMTADIRKGKDPLIDFPPDVWKRSVSYFLTEIDGKGLFDFSINKNPDFAYQYMEVMVLCDEYAVDRIEEPNARGRD